MDKRKLSGIFYALVLVISILVLSYFGYISVNKEFKESSFKEIKQFVYNNPAKNSALQESETATTSKNGTAYNNQYTLDFDENGNAVFPYSTKESLQSDGAKQIRNLAERRNEYSNIVLSDENEDFVIKDGFIFTKDESEIIFCFSKEKQIFLPEGILQIGDYAFYKSSITKIRLSNTIEKIGAYAFNDVPISELSLPKNLKTVGANAFSKNGFKEIIIPDGVEKIDEFAFDSSTAESLFIPESVKELGICAFICSNVKTITVECKPEVLKSSKIYVSNIDKLTQREHITVKSKYTLSMDTVLYIAMSCKETYVYMPGDKNTYEFYSEAFDIDEAKKEFKGECSYYVDKDTDIPYVRIKLDNNDKVKIDSTIKFHFEK